MLTRRFFDSLCSLRMTSVCESLPLPARKREPKADASQSMHYIVLIPKSEVHAVIKSGMTNLKAGHYPGDLA